MALYTIHAEPVVRRYRAELGSLAFLFQLLVFLCTTVVSFLVAYSTGSFWVDSIQAFEQPDIQYKGQIIVQTQGSVCDAPLFWSSIGNLNSLMQANLRVPVVTTAERDTDYDGKPERDADHHISARHGLIDVQHDSPREGGNYTFSGSVGFVQTRPLMGVRDNDILNMASTSIRDYDLSNIILEYVRRNVTMTLNDLHETWRCGRAVDDPFVITGSIRYAETSVLYEPTFWETVKLAWIQFLTTFSIFWYVSRILTAYVFNNRLFMINM
eukprot:Clim_evm165s157 gene=Clim_evmTU165s157